MQQDFIINHQSRRSAVFWRSQSSIVRYLSSPLYICRESSTNHLLFMQNKPNFQKSQMNLKFCKQMAYENKSNWTIGQSKPNSNPIKPNLKRAKMNINSFITKDYRKKDDFLVRINKPNSNPISATPKMNVNLYVIEDYENKRLCRPKKTNPNKANFRILPKISGKHFLLIKGPGLICLLVSQSRP